MEVTHPPAYTTRASIEEAVGMDLLPSEDPIIIKIVVGELPRVRPELKADLYGSGSAPGVVEGIARVISTEKQLDQVQPGELPRPEGTDPLDRPGVGVRRHVGRLPRRGLGAAGW